VSTDAGPEAGQGTTVDENKVFVPALAVFHCRWCQPDSEHVREMLPVDVAERSVVGRLNCSARMEAEFAIKAFSEGYDGVAVIGCEMGECHFRVGNEQAARRLRLLGDILALAGIYPERLGVFWASPFDEDIIRRWVEEYIESLKKIGPFKDRDRHAG
jgi:coenzyme F420-reducing hydrogenase delta subunit